jgi:hypothetical protein
MNPTMAFTSLCDHPLSPVVPALIVFIISMYFNLCLHFPTDSMMPKAHPVRDTGKRIWPSTGHIVFLKILLDHGHKDGTATSPATTSQQD